MSKVCVKNSKIQGLEVFSISEFKLCDHMLQIDDSRIVNEVNPLKPELGEHECHCDYLAGRKVNLMKSPMIIVSVTMVLKYGNATVGGLNAEKLLSRGFSPSYRIYRSDILISLITGLSQNTVKRMR